MIAVLAALAASRAARANVTADDLLLVVNKQQPAGRALAEEYAKLRGVPDGRIVEVDVRDVEEIQRPFYDRSIADVVRQEIAARGLRERIKVAVLFYGLPLRILEPGRTLPEKAELANILVPAERTLIAYLGGIAARVEATATAVDPSFKPAANAPATADGVRLRLTVAEQAIRIALPTMADAAAREKARGELEAAKGDIAKLPFLPFVPRGAPPAGPPPTEADVNALLKGRDDAVARRRLRELVASGNNSFQLLALIEEQKNFLGATEAEASVDSELSCLWLSKYPLTRFIGNPWHYASASVGLRPQVLRTARIDGPTEAIARRTFNNAIVAEQRGLEGDAVFDSRGLGRESQYGLYDGTIRRAADLATGAAGLSVLRDDAEPLMKDGTSARTALYCGWYNLHRYRPTVAMLPGAVAYHVASFELISLRPPTETGWVRGLMIDGADVTLGPVAEPYLVAFPPADEFFGLLMTGRTTLVEAYWATNPVTSWRMILIGDPLYRPFAKRPAIDAAKLAPALRATLDAQ